MPRHEGDPTAISGGAHVGHVAIMDFIRAASLSEEISLDEVEKIAI
jgi:hypothetical protein